MPEYSGNTITPADGVQVPSMNGNTAGNILLSAVKSYILSGAGQANGLATLGSDGKLTAAQLPDLADDVIVVTTYANLPSPGTAAKIYITADNNKGYRWDPELTTPGYVKIFELDKSIVFGYYSSGSFYEDSEHTVQITPVEHVFYVDVSLADIYVLNDGTLIELLGTKWAKITDIQDGTIQAGVAVKAFQDAMGRAIITTYATKADLQDGTLEPLISTKSRQDQNGNVIDQTYETKAEASDLKDALQATNARVSNLEEAQGGYYEVDVKSPYTIPSGKAKNWAVNVLRGVTRGKNQLAQNGDFTDGFTGWNRHIDSTPIPTVTDGVASFTVTASGGGIYHTGIKIVSNHKYLVAFRVKATTANTTVYITTNMTGIKNYNFSLGTSWTDLCIIETATADSDSGIAQFRDGRTANWDALYCDSLLVTDLTTFFGGNIPSNAQTIADIQQNYPELLVPSAYGSSLVSTVYEGVKTIGSNRMSLSGLEAVTSANVTFTPTFNSEGELEFITATGTSNASGNFDLLRNDDFHLPMGTYFVGFGANSLFYDILVYVNGTWATINKNGGTITVTDPSQAIWIRGRFSSGVASGGAKLYPKINIGSTELPFSPYFTDTLSLPTTVKLRSAGTVAEEFDLESGEVTRNCSNVLDLANLVWSGSSGVYSTTALASLMKLPATNGEKASLSWDNPAYTLKSVNSDSGVAGSGDMFVRPNGEFIIRSSSSPTGHIVYALATPTTEQLEPIQNSYLATEAGGTISSILTDAVDDSMTLGYINL